MIKQENPNLNFENKREGSVFDFDSKDIINKLEQMREEKQ